MKTAWPNINVRREEMSGFHLLNCDITQFIYRIVIGVARDVRNNALVSGKMLLKQVTFECRLLMTKYVHNCNTRTKY